ncbi:S41 family peptidase [Metabacillus sp. GX 13764]|uniref:S41 family peptidase n=1 Tax=Metabacillus kandeliae TaxID=2900151 RepID=UPI001E50F48B|nr:S41 family peptidase [Metabacillus kandeliae]MCD7035960.1 S41 family peptidase [Metabacillus kandeliae]
MKQKVIALIIGCTVAAGAGGMFAGTKLADEEKAAVPASSLLAKETGEAEFPGLEKVKQAYELITDKYVEKVDREKLYEGAIQGMLSTLKDPYSIYMNKDTAKQFSDALDSSFQGIGAEVGLRDGKVIIVSPFKGSPAEKAGLHPNDEILRIDGKAIEGEDLNETVLRIRGKKGTQVILEIRRAGTADPIAIPVKRDDIPLETVFSKVKTNENGKKAGIIQITSFSENTAADFTKQLKKLEKEKIDGLVIDVRGNPGGYLQSVEEILKQFIPKDKPYIQIEQRNGDKTPSYSALAKKKSYPVNVLINKGSASASEILAGAMKEAGQYDLVGDTSFGKGTVQQAIPMGDGSNIKLTLYKWLTPDGNWIHKHGIEPTIAVSEPGYFTSGPLQPAAQLKKDMNSDEIKTAQVLLKGLGYDPGREDGYFSLQTEQAVKAFQKKNSLPATGIITQSMAEKINTQIQARKLNAKNDVQLNAAIKALF